MKYVVSVTRIGYACRNFEIEAESETEAQDLALEVAGNHEFSEHHSEYDIDYVGEVKNEN